MNKKLTYGIGVYGILIGLLIAIATYLKDTNFGSADRLLALIGISIAIFSLFLLLVSYRKVLKYNGLGIEIKPNKITLHVSRYGIGLEDKKFFASVLLFVLLSLSLMGLVLINLQPMNRLNVVGPQTTTVAGTEVVMPFPMTVTIDDTGWRHSWRSNHTPHTIDDYENIVYIGEQVGTRLMCAFIISDFDKTNICSEYPTTTEFGREWNNTANLSTQDEEIMQYIKNNSAYLEYGLHGVRHEMWSDGLLVKDGYTGGQFSNDTRGEWYDIKEDKPWNQTAVKNHAYVFDRISKQYNLTFPRSMVPPDHGYYYNLSSNASTSALLNDYGLKYVTTDFNLIPELGPEEGLDHGVLLLHRASLGIPHYSTGTVPNNIVFTTSGMTHFPNFYAEDPENNKQVAEKWITWFNTEIKDNPHRYVPKNNAQLNSQWLYCKYAKLSNTDNKLIIDTSEMPEEAYKHGLVGNLVLKISLPPDKHISEANIDGKRIAGYYEDRGFAYIILPILNKSVHKLSFKFGSEYMPTYVLNDGTYNVLRFTSTEDIVKLDLEIYGTQNVRIKTLFEPKEVATTNCTVETSKYDSKDNILSIRLKTQDVQGARTKLTLIP